MKKIVLLLFASFILFSLSSSAQIAKGSVLLGGGISAGAGKANSSTTLEDRTNSLAVYPAIGIAVSENTVVGLRLSYAHGKTEQTATGYSSLQEQNGHSAGVFYRQYMALGKKFYLFGEGAASYGYSRYTNENRLAETKTVQSNHTVGVDLYPGVAFAVTKNLHLEAGLNNLVNISYTRNKTENTYQNTTTNSSKGSGFNLTTNVSTASPLTVGFRFVLGR